MDPLSELEVQLIDQGILGDPKQKNNSGGNMLLLA